MSSDSRSPLSTLTNGMDKRTTSVHSSVAKKAKGKSLLHCTSVPPKDQAFQDLESLYPCKNMNAHSRDYPCKNMNAHSRDYPCKNMNAYSREGSQSHRVLPDILNPAVTTRTTPQRSQNWLQDTNEPGSKASRSKDISHSLTLVISPRPSHVNTVPEPATFSEDQKTGQRSNNLMSVSPSLACGRRISVGFCDELVLDSGRSRSPVLTFPPPRNLRPDTLPPSCQRSRSRGRRGGRRSSSREEVSKSFGKMMPPRPLNKEEIEDLSQYVHHFEDGYYKYRMRQHGLETLSALTHVSELLCDVKENLSVREYLQMLQYWYNETLEQPSKFFLYYLGEKYRPQHVVLSESTHGISKHSHELSDQVPTKHIIQMGEEIRRLQGVRAKQLFGQILDYSLKHEHQLQMLADVLALLEGQHIILIENLSSFSIDVEDFTENFRPKIMSQMLQFMTQFESAVNQVRSLAIRLDLLQKPNEPKPVETKLTVRDQILQLYRAADPIPQAGLMMQEEKHFWWSVLQLSGILSLCTRVTDSSDIKSNLQCGLDLFRNMMDVVADNFVEGASRELRVVMLHKNLAQIANQLENGLTLLEKTKSVQDLLQEKYQVIMNKLEVISNQNADLLSSLDDLQSFVLDLMQEEGDKDLTELARLMVEKGLLVAAQQKGRGRGRKEQEGSVTSGEVGEEKDDDELEERTERVRMKKKTRPQRKSIKSGGRRVEAEEDEMEMSSTFAAFLESLDNIYRDLEEESEEEEWSMFEEEQAKLLELTRKRSEVKAELNWYKKTTVELHDKIVDLLDYANEIGEVLGLPPQFLNKRDDDVLAALVRAQKISEERSTSRYDPSKAHKRALRQKKVVTETPSLLALTSNLSTLLTDQAGLAKEKDNGEQSRPQEQESEKKAESLAQKQAFSLTVTKAPIQDKIKIKAKSTLRGKSRKVDRSTSEDSLISLASQPAESPAEEKTHSIKDAKVPEKELIKTEAKSISPAEEKAHSVKDAKVPEKELIKIEAKSILKRKSPTQTNAFKAKAPAEQHPSEADRSTSKDRLISLISQPAQSPAEEKAHSVKDTKMPEEKQNKREAKSTFRQKSGSSAIMHKADTPKTKHGEPKQEIPTQTAKELSGCESGLAKPKLDQLGTTTIARPLIMYGNKVMTSTTDSDLIEKSTTKKSDKKYLVHAKVLSKAKGQKVPLVRDFDLEGPSKEEKAKDEDWKSPKDKEWPLSDSATERQVMGQQMVSEYRQLEEVHRKIPPATISARVELGIDKEIDLTLQGAMVESLATVPERKRQGEQKVRDTQNGQLQEPEEDQTGLSLISKQLVKPMPVENSKVKSPSLDFDRSQAVAPSEEQLSGTLAWKSTKKEDEALYHFSEDGGSRTIETVQGPTRRDMHPHEVQYQTVPDHTHEQLEDMTLSDRDSPGSRRSPRGLATRVSLVSQIRLDTSFDLLMCMAVNKTGLPTQLGTRLQPLIHATSLSPNAIPEAVIRAGSISHYLKTNKSLPNRGQAIPPSSVSVRSVIALPPVSGSGYWLSKTPKKLEKVTPGKQEVGVKDDFKTDRQQEGFLTGVVYGSSDDPIQQAGFTLRVDKQEPSRPKNKRPKSGKRPDKIGSHVQLPPLGAGTTAVVPRTTRVSGKTEKAQIQQRGNQAKRPQINTSLRKWKQTDSAKIASTRAKIMEVKKRLPGQKTGGLSDEWIKDPEQQNLVKRASMRRVPILEELSSIVLPSQTETSNKIMSREKVKDKKKSSDILHDKKFLKGTEAKQNRQISYEVIARQKQVQWLASADRLKFGIPSVSIGDSTNSLFVSQDSLSSYEISEESKTPFVSIEPASSSCALSMSERSLQVAEHHVAEDYVVQKLTELEDHSSSSGSSMSEEYAVQRPHISEEYAVQRPPISEDHFPPSPLIVSEDYASQISQVSEDTWSLSAVSNQDVVQNPPLPEDFPSLSAFSIPEDLLSLGALSVPEDQESRNQSTASQESSPRATPAAGSPKMSLRPHSSMGEPLQMGSLNSTRQDGSTRKKSIMEYPLPENKGKHQILWHSMKVGPNDDMPTLAQQMEEIRMRENACREHHVYRIEDLMLGHLFVFLIQQFLHMGMRLAKVMTFNDFIQQANKISIAVNQLDATVKVDPETMVNAVDEYFRVIQGAIQSVLDSCKIRTARNLIVDHREEQLNELKKKTETYVLKRQSLELQYRKLWMMHLQLCHEVATRQSTLELPANVSEKERFINPLTRMENNLFLPRAFSVTNLDILENAFRDKKISDTCLIKGRHQLRRVQELISRRLPLLTRLYRTFRQARFHENLCNKYLVLRQSDPVQYLRWQTYRRKQDKRLQERFQQDLADMEEFRQQRIVAIFHTWFLCNQILLGTGIRLVFPEARGLTKAESLRYSKLVEQLVKEKGVAVVTGKNVKDVLSTGRLPKSISDSSSSQLEVDARRITTHACSFPGLAQRAHVSTPSDPTRPPPGVGDC